MMKNIRLLCLFVLVSICFSPDVTAQNLIPNGDFELGNYNGGTNPSNYYSGVACSTGRDRFDSDLDNWYVAKPTDIWTSRCSPDWIAAGIVLGDGFCPANDSKYVRSASKAESFMTEMVGGYTLVKGKTYKFKVKVRAARGLDGGTGSFQVVFSKKEEGLRVQPHKKWVALDVYVPQSCDWRNIEAYFTVPTDDNKDYEDMKYIVLQYNHEQNESGDGDSASLILHYDEVSLVEEEKCIDVRYIQDWQYFDIHKIEQANVEIRAGANVSPEPWVANLPVVVKSNAKVIYRAPTVYLEPGFFVEEPGSYFETQVGTCVEDPCPPIEAFVPTSTTVCSSDITLGENIPAQPGVFYSWSPIEYFSNPWSRITDFTPPPGSGCVDTQLVIWTICGESQTFPFTMNYFDAAPSITVNNVTSGVNNLDIDLDINNANTYSVTAVSIGSGTVLYTNIETLGCDTVNDVLLNLDSCLLEMCEDVEVTITASSSCFNSVEEVITWTAPTPVAPVISFSNVIDTDFDYQFDVALPASYEYIVIETWNEAETSLICSQTVEACNDPNLSTYHFDVKNCLSGCVSQCHNYKIKVRLKNYCYPSEAVSTLSWNKSNVAFAMPNSYPNVITANGDGINDTLCFSPQGADYYHLIVVDRWGILIFESSGCVTSNPVCIWTPPTNITDGTYFYTIEFSNQCGQSGSNQDFVQVFNGFNRATVDEPDEFVPVNTTEVSVYPNPSKGIFNVNLGTLSEANLVVLDITGKTIFSKNATSNLETLNLTNYAKGVYFLRIKNQDFLITKKLIVE